MLHVVHSQVRGKYGYIDPDGNKREFTYVSGNPCDPNAVDEDEKQQEEAANEPENVPANYPIRTPHRPLRPVVQHKAPVTLFQHAYEQEEEDVQPEPEQVLRVHPVQPQRHRVLPQRPQYVEQAQPELVHQRPRIQLQPSTPAPFVYHSTPLSITPRPATAAPSRNALPATTYRPQLVQVAVTPRPALLYTKQIQQVTPRPISYSTPQPDLSATRATIDFAAEFQKFQTDNAVSPKPQLHKAKPAGGPVGQIYSSELVFDPATGQYNAQLYQTLPQTEGEFTLNHRIQPYVHQPTQHTPQLLTLQQLQHQSPVYRQHRPQPQHIQAQQQQQQQQQIQPSQLAYQQQQAGLQFQNSANLYARQQKAQIQYQQQAKQETAPQNYYYIQPSAPNGQQHHHQSSHNLAGGQIDAFLRGHNIQF